MEFTKQYVINSLKEVYAYAHGNISAIDVDSINTNDEYDGFYYGLIVRQRNICRDICILLENNIHNFYTSEMVLFRCLIDDYIHTTYIVNQPDSESVLTNLNAEAYKKNFSKTDELASLNGDDSTKNDLEITKQQFAANPENDKYFKDKESFKFKSFKSTGHLIKSLDREEYSYQLKRAYYLWREFSDFVHYSNFTFRREVMANSTEDQIYDKFAEVISYSYHTTYNSLQHFVKKYGLQIVDILNLKEYYKNSTHPGNYSKSDN